jgi:hypothetical protein
MFSELHKVIAAVVRELLISGPNLFLLPQPPLVPLSFNLLKSEGKRGV